MTEQPLTEDCDGKIVKCGDKVRVLGFQEGIFKSMPPEEIPFVKSMLHEVLEVEEVDENRLAWVWKSWDVGDGRCNMHGLGLEPHQMALVEKGA